VLLVQAFLQELHVQLLNLLVLLVFCTGVNPIVAGCTPVTSGDLVYFASENPTSYMGCTNGNQQNPQCCPQTNPSACVLQFFYTFSPESQGWREPPYPVGPEDSYWAGSVIAGTSLGTQFYLRSPITLYKMRQLGVYCNQPTFTMRLLGGNGNVLASVASPNAEPSLTATCIVVGNCPCEACIGCPTQDDVQWLDYDLVSPITLNPSQGPFTIVAQYTVGGLIVATSWNYGGSLPVTVNGITYTQFTSCSGSGCIPTLPTCGAYQDLVFTN